jgi:hypothetical protein
MARAAQEDNDILGETNRAGDRRWLVIAGGYRGCLQSGAASEIIATLPTGATTGILQVVTLNGTLSSNVAFRVR